MCMEPQSTWTKTTYGQIILRQEIVVGSIVSEWIYRILLRGEFWLKEWGLVSADVTQLAEYLEFSDLCIMTYTGTTLNTIVWKRSNLMSKKCHEVNEHGVLLNHEQLFTKKKTTFGELLTSFVVCEHHFSPVWKPCFSQRICFANDAGLRLGRIWNWPFTPQHSLLELLRRGSSYLNRQGPQSCCLNWPLELTFLS